MNNHSADSVAWFERDGGALLLQNQDAVRAAYPQLRWEARGGLMFLEGALRLTSECGVEDRMEIRVEFPALYPAKEPKVYDAASRFRHSAERHFYPDGRCCLWLPPLSPWREDDVQALLQLLHQTTIYFDKQLIFDVLKRWPGPAWDHNEMGYLEWFREKLELADGQLAPFISRIWRRQGAWGASSPCPCGSGMKYRRCHRDRVESINQMMDVPQWIESVNRIKAQQRALLAAKGY